MKVSVITITYRPGYIDTITQALRNQTMPKDDWELVLVDDLWEIRKEIVARHIGNAFNFTHIPPREIKDYSATAIAINTGIVHAKGDLLYFSADYMYPHPRCLERHWEIFEKFKPGVLISGPLLDGINTKNQSVWLEAQPVETTVEVDGKPITYHEHSPAISWPMKPDSHLVQPENLISIWAEPFIPNWPETCPPDWRLGWIGNFQIDNNLYVNARGPTWWWLGRNDSGSREVLMAVNGMNETLDGLHGGLDTEITFRLMELGCFHLVDSEAPAYVLPHPRRKKELKEVPKDRVWANLAEEEKKVKVKL